MAWMACTAALAAAGLAACARDGAAAGTARSAAGCDRFASPNGSDRGRRRGTRRRPFRSVPRVVASLRRGQTACLAPGSYSHGEPARLDRPRTALRGLAGGSVFVDGAIWIDPPARRASVSKLRLTASDQLYVIPLKVLADDVRVTRNIITGSSISTSCVLVGSHRRTSRTLIQGNRISRCGTEGKFDHLIYLDKTRGVRVRHNLLTANGGGWAVHMYPDADSTLIERNTIDGNLGGVVFAGDGLGATSDRNVVRYNAITYSGGRWNIESSWSDGPFGKRNRAHHNCLYTDGIGAPSGIGVREGFRAAKNVVLGGTPYLARLLGDFRLAPAGGCRRVLR